MKINIKKNTKLSLSLLVCSSALLLGATSTFAWDGTEVKEPAKTGETYQIGSAEELAWFAKEVNEGKTIDGVLIKDIDLENKELVDPIGKNGQNFKGIFDGENHGIKNLSIDNNKAWQGLFGKNEGTIKNFSVDGNVKVESRVGSGSVVAWNTGTVDNVTSSVNVSTTSMGSIGGIAGQNSAGGIISNSEFTGSITGASESGGAKHVGGIVGTNDSANLIGNINSGSVVGANGNAQSRVGGITGNWILKTPTIVANNINYGAVSASSTNAYIAGIAGFFQNDSRLGDPKTKHLFFNAVNFGKVTGDNPKEIDNIINSNVRIDKDDLYQSKNLYDSTTEGFKAENAIEAVNDFDGTEFESPITIPESAKFNLAKDGSIKLNSQLNRSKEEPVDEEKVKEAQAYLEKATASLKTNWYKSTPVFGQDTNVGTMLETYLEEKGFKDIKVSVTNSNDEDFVKKDGTIHYYYKNPNETDFMRFRTVKVDYKLTKDGASTTYDGVNAVIHWDRDKLTKITNDEITDKLTLETIKDKNESTEKFDKNLLLPKYVDGKKWAEVKWYSYDNGIITADNSLQTGGSANLSNPYIGKIRRGEKDQKVKLLAAVHNNFIQNSQPELVIEKEIEITVKGLGAESKDEIQALMDEHYTFDKMKDSITNEKIDPKNIVNDISLPNPKGTGVPLSHLYQFSAESHTPDVMTVNGYRLSVLRPLPGENPKKASFTVTMKERNSSLEAKQTFEVMIQPLTQKEIDDEIKLMDTVKENYFNGLNKEGNDSPENITKRLNTFQQVSFKEDGKTLDWVYNYKDLKDRGIVPVSIDESKPSEQWDKFHSSNNAVLQHESFFLTQPKNDTKVTVKSVLSSSVFEKYAKANPDNKDLKKLYRQPVSAELVVKGTEGENPNPEQIRKVGFSVIGEKGDSSYNNWLTTKGEGTEYTSVFDVFKNALDSNGYKFEGSNYISSITNPAGVTLTHKEHGPSSGWMYAVNGVITDKMPAEYLIEDGDEIVWFYVEDYQTDSRIKNGKFTAESEKESDMNKAKRLINAIGDVTLEKEAAIKEAREALNKVTQGSQEYMVLNSALEEMEAKLESLKIEAREKEAAKKTEDLIKLIGNVTLSSEESITKASQSYNELSEDAKKLVTNYDTLEAAKKTYAELVKNQKDQAAAKTVIDSIDKLSKPTMADKAEVDLTRNMFDSLSKEQQKLVTNYDVLETAEKIIKDLTSDIKAVNEAIAKLPETLSLSDKQEVDKLVKMYEALPEASKVFVEKMDALTNAEQQIILLEEAQPVVDLINEIGDVKLTSEKAITKARTAFDALSKEAQMKVSNLNDLIKAEAKFKELKELKDHRDTSKQELTDYKKMTDYRKEEQDKINKTLEEANTSIDKATEKSGIDKIVKEAKTNLDKVKTDKELTESELSMKELQTHKVASKDSLGAYKNLNNYRKAEQDKINAILKEANTSIEKATDKAGVDKIVKETKTNLDKIKTDKELTDLDSTTKELQAHKDASKKALGERKNLVNYRKEEQAKLNEILKKANNSIDNAKDKATVNAIVLDTQAKLDAVKTNKELTDSETGPQGVYIKDGRYVTVIKKGYNTWSDFNWNKRSNTDKLVGTTFESRGKYVHKNGATYLSLFDNNGKWQGYLNENATKAGDGKQGSYIKDGRYVTISSPNYDVWSNFNWKKRNSSSTLLNQTFQAKGQYKHFNGATYLSLYDNNGKWHGYINANAIKVGKGKQGAFIKDGHYVTITKNNYDIWSNFNWDKRTSSRKLLNQTFQVKGRYEHLNGSTYYSLYNASGEWQGYINSNATKVGKGKQGAYITDGRKVTINKKGYTTWSNFSWKERSTTNKMMGKKFTARGRYHHTNGAVYYSLYDNNGKWHGYINKNAVR